MEEVKHDKCTRCKSWKPIPMFLNATGRKLKSCELCRNRDKKNKNKNKCEHGRIKSTCKECGGASICEHGRIQSTCKECGGSQICEHGRRKAQCKECGGGSICEHGREKSKCKECGGGSICEHNRMKSTCKDCDPQGHLSSVVRSAVKNALKSNKSKPSIEYLGCSIEEFKEHIEKQFEEGMTWENHGEWHIDHIIPLKYENPTLEETIERLHWSNTQPLWAEENIAKGNRFCG